MLIIPFVTDCFNHINSPGSLQEKLHFLPFTLCDKTEMCKPLVVTVTLTVKGFCSPAKCVMFLYLVLFLMV